MKIYSQIYLCLSWVVPCIALAFECNPIYGVLFFIPFCITPLIISAFLSFKFESNKSQTILLASNVAYLIWFGFVYRDVFYVNLDAQGPIAFLFVGIFSVPVMAIFWGLSYYVNKKVNVADDASV